MLTVLSMLLIMAAILFGIMNFIILAFFYMSTKWGYTIEQSRTSFLINTVLTTAYTPHVYSNKWDVTLKSLKFKDLVVWGNIAASQDPSTFREYNGHELVESMWWYFSTLPARVVHTITIMTIGAVLSPFGKKGKQYKLDKVGRLDKVYKVRHTDSKPNLRDIYK